ncbi:alkane hydroxylase MAH1-like [Solanum verrucosum]|uniref:alkane hydroxylase MAH1-like n=1 Tax=Solanum verrucosum TaxID=315347 RepID=UPI0020D1C34C|nr:alkane hydroxylase MAH1-like [Solanum verrucosum]
MAFNFLVLASIGYIEIFVAIFFFFVLVFEGKGDFGWKWPFFGEFPSLLFHINTIHQSLTILFSRIGATALVKGPCFANMDILGTVDPKNVHYIMSANFQNFQKGPEFKKIFDVLGDGIFNADFDLWKNQRKIAKTLITHHTFHNFLVKTSCDMVKNGLVPVLEFMAKEGRVFDLQDVFQRFTFDTTCILVTGFDPGSLSIDLNNIAFMKAMNDAGEVMVIRNLLPQCVWKLQKWLGIGPEKKLRDAREVIDRVIGKYISMKCDELRAKGEKMNENEEEEGVDLLASYIANDDGEIKTGLMFDDKFLRDTILNFMIAGRDTTSSGLTWFIWLVVTHPEIEKKIREELKAIISLGEEGEKQRLFKGGELKNAIYLHAALCESLRLYPPVPFQLKTPQEPDVLPSGHRVHPKMRVMVILYAMGRMESVWGKDALEFKPERWISERGTVKHEPSYKFFSFNAGPRICLGKEVAFTQMKAVAAAIIHNFHVEMVKGHEVCPNVSVILYMKHGFKVRIRNRWT